MAPKERESQNRGPHRILGSSGKVLGTCMGSVRLALTSPLSPLDYRRTHVAPHFLQGLPPGWPDTQGLKADQGVREGHHVQWDKTKNGEGQMTTRLASQCWKYADDSLLSAGACTVSFVPQAILEDRWQAG